jgi:hypothetical protein
LPPFLILYYNQYEEGFKLLNIFEVSKDLEKTETKYNEKKMALLQREDDLLLNSDWATLKSEQGISNQGQRDAWIRMKTGTLKQEVTELRICRDALKRLYTALLYNSKEEKTTEMI